MRILNSKLSNSDELYSKSILDDKQMRGILGTKERSTEMDRESRLTDNDMEL